MWRRLGFLSSPAAVATTAVIVILLSPFAAYGAVKWLDFVFRSEEGVTPDRGAIIGTWTNPDGARLVFQPNGTYTASGMLDIPAGSSPADDVLPPNGSGTWRIDWQSAANPGGVTLVTGPSSFTDFFTTGTSANPSLFATIGNSDDDDHFTFTKKG